MEIPYIKLEDIDKVKDALAEGGVSPGVCGPRVRTVTACQGSAICPSGCIDTSALARELSERYFGRELPHKFKFGVTGCVNNCLKAEENDFGVKGGLIVSFNPEKCTRCRVCTKACRQGALSLSEEEKITKQDSLCNNCGRCVKSCPAEAWTGEPGYIVSFGGLFGNRIFRGENLIPIIRDKETLLRVADATINYFAANAKPGERFRSTLERLGIDDFKKRVTEAYNG